MSKIIQVLSVKENRVVMMVSFVEVTFGLHNGNVVDVSRISPARNYIPQNIMWDAKKQAKAILLEKKEKSQKTSA